MIYKFIAISDIHWGAMDCTLTYQNLTMVLEFIKKMKDQVDFLVICGDYFDYRLQLNSKTAITAINWFDQLVKTCKESGVKKIRLVRGTSSHDNDQLEVFRPAYVDDDEYVQIHNVTTSEELLPGLRCIFCPDEDMNAEEYHKTYISQFYPTPDIGFFHGNFDCVLPSIKLDQVRDQHLPTMIYDVHGFSRLIKGPLIAGHYHVAYSGNNLFYTGSYDRWKFDEDEDKGFLYGAYNTDDSSYYIHQVKNPLARIYKTIVVMDEDCHTTAHFSNLIGQIDQLLEDDPTMRIRVVYYLNNNDPATITNYNTFQTQFATISRVKIEMKNLAKKSKRDEEKESVRAQTSQLHYIYDKDRNNIPKIIRRFISDTKHQDLSEEEIVRCIGKYLKK